jgi:membrane-bound serine protease (ClpP class)
MWCHLLLGVPVFGIALFVFLPLSLALPTYFLASGVSAFVWMKVYRAMQIPVTSGQEAMVGRSAEVRSWSGRQGQVLFQGELWTARSPEPLPPGTRVRIEHVEGLKLWVRPVAEGRSIQAA